MNAIQQKRNHDQSSVSRAFATWVNGNRGENSPAIDEMLFFPHPQQWRSQSQEKKVNISRAAAMEFMASYRKFGVEVACTFEDWLTDISLAAQG